jgi:membrane protein YqaA with SNARE-associated domain
MYVLVSQSSHGSWTDYYLGKTYVHQGERWASLGRQGEAKIYRSEKRANRAAESLSEKVGYTFVVEEFKG